VILRFNTSTPVILLAMCLAQFSFAQTTAKPTAENKPQTKEEKKTAAKEEKKAAAALAARDSKNLTGEQIAESTIFIYGAGGGRPILNQIRKTTLERGKINITNAEGRTDQATYYRWIQRAETLNKEKIRLDQEFSNARYSLVFNDEKIFGIVDDAVFTPRDDASVAFENQIVHSLEALLRYKENESKLDLVGNEKILGVEYHILDVTDKQGRKTRFYISAKRFRVMMLDYEQNGVKYRRRFYDYNYAQGTLVPFRTVLWAGDKLVEETEVGTITFGQKIDETMFSAG
jgi:hypothetical protein